MLQSDNAKLLFSQSDKSKNSWLWVLFGGRSGAGGHLKSALTEKCPSVSQTHHRHKKPCVLVLTRSHMLARA
jgi:hypothetical protein